MQNTDASEQQGKQTKAVGTLLCLSLHSEEMNEEEEVVQFINSNNRDRKR